MRSRLKRPNRCDLHAETIEVAVRNTTINGAPDRIRAHAADLHRPPDRRRARPSQALTNDLPTRFDKQVGERADEPTPRARLENARFVAQLPHDASSPKTTAFESAKTKNDPGIVDRGRRRARNESGAYSAASRIFSTSCSAGHAPKSPSWRSRTLTVPFSTSLSPSTTM